MRGSKCGCLIRAWVLESGGSVVVVLVLVLVELVEVELVEVVVETVVLVERLVEVDCEVDVELVECDVLVD